MLMLFQDFFHFGDDFVALAAPVGRQQHVAGAFAAEALDGGLWPDDFDHLGHGGAVFLELQELDFAVGEVGGHLRAHHDVEGVDFHGCEVQVADHFRGALEVFQGFAREAHDDMRGDGEARALAAFDGIFEFCQSVPAIDGGQRQIVCGLEANLHDDGLDAVHLGEEGDFLVFEAVRTRPDGEPRHLRVLHDGLDDFHQVLEGGVCVGVGLEVGEDARGGVLLPEFRDEFVQLFLDAHAGLVENGAETAVVAVATPGKTLGPVQIGAAHAAVEGEFPDFLIVGEQLLE